MWPHPRPKVVATTAKSSESADRSCGLRGVDHAQEPVLGQGCTPQAVGRDGDQMERPMGVAGDRGDKRAGGGVEHVSISLDADDKEA